MPEKYRPTPDDMRPPESDMNTDNDTFLNDLGERMENNPLTQKELEGVRDANAYRHALKMEKSQSSADIEQLIASTKEDPDDQRARQEHMTSAVQEQERMAALSHEAQRQYRLVRTINEQVRHEALKKQGSAELGRLANAIIETWRTLEEAQREYISDGEVVVFEHAIQESLEEFHRIENGIERLQNKL